MTAAHRADLRAPTLALPTLALLALTLLAWASTLAAALTGLLPLWAGTALCTLCAYVAFTPMHDSAHRAVARQRTLNDLVGRLAALPLTAPFPAFRWVHLEHHKHTNEPEHDPDHWSGRGPTLLLPLRWLTQDLHYYARYLARWSERPSRERLEVAGNLAAQVALVTGLIASGYVWEVVLLVLVPARLAIAALAWAFDYLPHRPHTTLARDDRFRATHIVSGPALTVPFLAQNYHLVHHLYPAVPFYRYARVWRAQRQDLLDQGARVVPLLGAPF